MAGLVPAIHVVFRKNEQKQGVMPGTSLDKPGHDGGKRSCIREVFTLSA
jgi:hypothetical protein